MSFFPQVLARLMPGRARVPEIQKGSATGALVAFEQLGQPVWSPRDYAAFAREGFMQNAICYRSVRMIAEAAASIPLLLYEGDTEIGDHPLIDLLRRPSLDHTGTDFLEAWYGFLLVAGNAYVEAVPLDGQLRELHVLRPDRMKVIPGPDGWPEGYDYTAGGQSIRFIDDVVPGVRPILHMRMFNPLNDHYGMSPIEAASVAIDIHNTASAWNKALLDNSARPSGALVYGAGNGQMTAEQFARLKAELETSFEGARNAGRPLLLEGGLDWKPLSMSPKDMDFIEAKNSAAREIALALGVPPMLLGIPGDNTYSNYREASRALWRQTVLPLVNRTAKAFSAWLEPAYGGLIELRPDLDAIEALSSEREALWSRLEAASFLTDDEKRAVIGYGPKGAAKGGAGPFDAAGGRARKFNPNHDALGRFATGDGAASGANDAPIGRDGVDASTTLVGGSSASNQSQRYTVNLEDEDARGGHAKRDHVGKEDAELIKVVKNKILRGGNVDLYGVSQSSFFSIESANDFTNRILQENTAQVDLVAKGELPYAWLDKRFGYPTGKEAFRDSATAEPYMRTTYSAGVLIVPDRTSDRGYRIHTAYPYNDRPD